MVKRNLSNTFHKFFDSEKSSGILLIICTVISLLITNTTSGAGYLSLWQTYVGGLSLEHWINDALTAGTIGFLWLKFLSKPEATDSNTDTVDFKQVSQKQ